MSKDKKNKSKLFLKLLAMFTGFSGISIFPIFLAFVVTITSLSAGVAGILWILQKEEQDKENGANKCTCQFLSEEEIAILNGGGTITVPGTGTGGNTPSIGTGDGSSNISGTVISGDYVNELFFFLKNTNEQYFKIPLWVTYAINSEEDSGSIYSKNPFKEGIYNGIDGALTLGTTRKSYNSGAAGIWQMEYNSSAGFLNRINGKEQEVANFYKGIGIDVTKYPGPLTTTYEYKALGFRTWDKDPLYIPGATYGFLATLQEQHEKIVNSGLLETPELSSCSASEKEFIGWLLTTTAWNNNVSVTIGTSKKNFKQDATVRKLFAAFAKLMSDPAFQQEFKGTRLSNGGNLSDGVRKWVTDKAVSAGYITEEDKKYLNNLPNYKRMYFDNEVRAREIQYAFNGVHYIMSNAEGALAKHGVTVNSWGFIGGATTNTAPAPSTGNTAPSTGNTAPSTSDVTTMRLKYTSTNLDGTVQPEYNITSCKPLSIEWKPLTSMTGGYPKASTAMNGLVIHYNSGPSSVDGIYSTFNGTSTASSFDVDVNGRVAMYLPLNQYGICSNAENGKKIGIEVGNRALDDGQYPQVTYEALVHLVAYLCYELNFDLDFNFVAANKTNNVYRDTGTVMRHYDVSSTSGHYAKGCPAYWVPKDGSVSNANSSHLISNLGGKSIPIVEGGNARWISFKTEVIKYIIKYRNDPNFKVLTTDGSEIPGLDWARQNTSGTFNWKNSALSSIQTIEGDGTGFTSNIEGGTDNTDDGSVDGKLTYTGKHRNFTSSCQMEKLGYCGCYRGSAGCKCGCNGRSDAPWVNGTTGEVTTPDGNGGGTIDGSTAPSYDANNGLAVPATRQYTMADVKSTGPQRVIDTALVTFQEMYITGSANLGKCPLYTQTIRTASYNYKGLSQPGFTTATGNKVAGRYDCSSYVGGVLQNMGCTLLNMPTSGTVMNANLTSYGFVKLPFSLATLQPGDIVSKSGHTEIFVGWQNEATHVAYVYNWGSSQRLANYNDGVGNRGKAHGDSEGISGAPGANNNTPGALITGPSLKTYSEGSFVTIQRFTGQ